MRDPFVLYEKSGRVVTLTLNRPARRNAISEHADCADMVETLAIASLVHDLGMLGLEPIVNRKGKLDEQEYTGLQHYPDQSARML